MNILRRALYLHAAVWTASGITVVAVPRVVLETIFNQGRYADVAYVRVSGVLSMALALVMVLVAQRLEDHWWWSWTFVFGDAGLVVVTLANAIVGVPDGSSPVLWWLFAGTNLTLGVAVVAGLAKAGTERSPI